MNIVVFLKQVPMVTDLPWDPKTGQMRREAAEGMMDPASKHALEAALCLKDEHGGRITVITMGPPAAEEVLREALALGADLGVLVSDVRLSGADTPATSYTLSLAVRAVCPEFDLLMLGCHSVDSETGQVGPHLAEELNLPGPAYVESVKLVDHAIRVERVCDNFLETLEIDLPALVTVTTQKYKPRPVPLGGVERAFSQGEVITLNASDLRADLKRVGFSGSAGRILRVYAPRAEQKGVLLKGAPKKCVQELLSRYGDRLSALVGKDLGEAK
jgi:electron transfer flavoprotein beta subunit